MLAESGGCFMLEVIFPQKTNQRYWDIHYSYVLNIFLYAKWQVSFRERDDFIVTINNEDFLFDFWDTSEVRQSNLRTFKFHTKEADLDKVIPFAPVSFYDWDKYYAMEKEIKYDPTKSLISCRQRPYAGALERRTQVHAMLKAKFGSIIATELVGQESYWKEAGDMGLSICVPGFCNNMIDRGQLQYMGLGCCTVSPHLPEILPFRKKFIHHENYLQCLDDYLTVEYYIASQQNGINRTLYSEIGEKAKQLFKDTCTPESLAKWIIQQI
jgi:hypothetical protein